MCESVFVCVFVTCVCVCVRERERERGREREASRRGNFCQYDPVSALFELQTSFVGLAHGQEMKMSCSHGGMYRFKDKSWTETIIVLLVVSQQAQLIHMAVE